MNVGRLAWQLILGGTLLLDVSDWAMDVVAVGHALVPSGTVRGPSCRW